MPVSYSLSGSVLEFTFEGKYTMPEALAAIEQAIASVPPGARPEVLVDVTKSEEKRSYETIHMMALPFGLNAASLSGRIALVVSTQAQFGGVRQFGAMLERYGVEARPFQDRPAAVSWLQGED